MKGAFCAPVPRYPALSQRRFHFTVSEFRVRGQRHPRAPLYMPKEDHRTHPMILRGSSATSPYRMWNGGP
jgi:hypothetical protein